MKHYVPAHDIAAYFAVLGEKQKAIFWLQKALRDHSAAMEWRAVDPIFDSLRPDPMVPGDLAENESRKHQAPCSLLI